MSRPMGPSARQHISSSALTVLLCSAFFLLNTSFTYGKVNNHIRMFRSMHGGTHPLHWQLASAPVPTDAQCRAAIGVPCYSPKEMQNAYNLTPFLNAGYAGKGQTIVIIDAFGSPTALADLKQFDKDYGLPDPPSFKVLSPFGTVPFDPTNIDQLGWAQETSLDVQWAHAMAPAADILLMTSPISETQGILGMLDFLKLEEYALDHHLGTIISQSWGATENTLSATPEGLKILSDFEAFYERAASAGVTVLTAAGDSGTANPDINNTIYTFPTVNYPASSPWVTAVGGTSLHADTNGKYESETVWNNGIRSATGGGVSQYFDKPSYQDGLPDSDQQLLDGHRAIPDIAYNADPRTSIPVYMSFIPGPGNQGYYLFGGTSEGAPQWAGMIADANQLAHHSLGFLNPKLYQLGSDEEARSEFFHDITSGNNAQDPLPGYSATAGWDAVTGWGTPIAEPLLKKLAHME